MGEQRPDNGGVTPPDDGGNPQPDGLPALPPEWGTIIIPDDASQLDAEAREIRRELRLRGPGLRRRHGDFDAADEHREQPSLAVPVAIMVVAVLTTLVSLFVASWGRPAQPVPGTSLATPAPQGAPPPAESRSGPATGSALGAVQLVDPAGAPIRLAELVPAVILFVDECDCTRLVLEVARGVPAGVTVVALGETPPVIFGAPTNVRSLAAGKDSILRTRYAAGVSPPPDAATAVIVDRAAAVVAVIPGAEAAADITPLVVL